MLLQLSHLSQQLKNDLALSIEEILNNTDINENSRPIFMCNLGATILGRTTHNFRMYEFFLRSTREYFRCWITTKYSYIILTENIHDSWLSARAPFNIGSLNSIRLNYLNHLLEQLKLSI